MNPDLDLIRVNQILDGGPIRRVVWRLIHRMPCAVVHRLCPLCRDEGVCDRCAPTPTNCVTIPSSETYTVRVGSTLASRR